MTTSSSADEQRFSGFPAAALDFYEDLEDDNSKAFWDAHRATYDTAVRAPLDALLRELAPAFGAAHVFRPYRDLRFRKDKSRPYKEQAAAVVRREAGTGLYVQLSAAGLRLGGGAWHLERDQLLRLREAVADERRGAELDVLLADVAQAGFTRTGEALVRVPKPWTADHPRADLLRAKSLAVVRDEPATSTVLHERACLELVRDGWRAVEPLLAWVVERVGPTTAPAPRRR